MNCYNHPALPAVAQCPQCNKGLCAECASVYTHPICNVCNRRLINNEKGRIIRELVITFGIGILLGVLFTKEVFAKSRYGIFEYVMFSYAFAGIVAGWKSLTRLTAGVFLFLPLIGWLLYAIVKLFLSFWVGLIMLPVRTVRNLTRLITLRRH